MTLTLRNAIGVVMAVVAPTVVLQLPGTRTLSWNASESS